MIGFFNLFPFTLYRSLLTAFLCAVILNLALFSSCSAIQAVPVHGATQRGQPPQVNSASSPSGSVQSGAVQNGSVQSEASNRQVINVVVDKMENGAVYAKDGRKFDIGASTRVIDNSRSHPGARARTAALFFANGCLESVILK